MAITFSDYNSQHTLKLISYISMDVQCSVGADHTCGQNLVCLQYFRQKLSHQAVKARAKIALHEKTFNARREAREDAFEAIFACTCFTISKKK